MVVRYLLTVGVGVSVKAPHQSICGAFFIGQTVEEVFILCTVETVGVEKPNEINGAKTSLRSYFRFSAEIGVGLAGEIRTSSNQG